MADSILRLRVDSAEYDDKLKRAAEGIQRLASKIHDSQGEFVGLTNDQKEFIRNLQYMNTVSQTATGKVKELETAYKGLQTMYNGFNAFEKNSEEGKILAEQLSILKEKTLQARKEMEDANKSLSNTGGFLDQLTSKFTVNIDALKLFDIGMKAAGAALDVAKDAFFASEATVDEWGRVMDSSKSLYEGFLTALNTGDISGYLSRIDSIVQAARIAYNELDRLGTMKTIQAPQMSAQQTENERMRMMIQTGRYIAPVDGRKASMQNGQLLTPEQIKRIEQQLQGGMQKVVTLVGNEVAQTSRAIDAVYNRQAQELGMSLKEFRKGTSSMAEFDKRMAGYENYQKWRTEHTTIDMQSGREIVARGNPFEQYAKWGTFRVDGERYNNLVGLIQQRDQQAGQAYGMQSQVYRTMNRAQGITLRQIMGGGGGGRSGGRSGGGISVADMLLSEFNKANGKIDASSLMDTTTAGGSELFKMLQAQHQAGLPTPATQGEKDAFENRRKEVKAELKKNDEEKNKKDKDAVEVADQIYGGVSSMVSSLEQMGIELPEGLKQVVGSIGGVIGLLQSIMMIVNAIQSVNEVGTFLGLFKNGGIVPHAQNGINVVGGTHYSGDVTPILANAGEVVLNRSQVSTLASSLQNPGMQNMKLEATVSGEQLRFVLNNNGRRTGRGEYVQSTKRS